MRINPSDIPDLPSAKEPAKPPETISPDAVAKLAREVSDLLSKEHDRLVRTGMSNDMAGSYVISSLMNANGTVGALFVAEILAITGKPLPSSEDHLRLGREVTLKLAEAFNKFLKEKLGASAMIVDVRAEDLPRDPKKAPPQDPPKKDPKDPTKDDWAL